MAKLNKSLIISLVSIVIGVGTIAVGLYVLSQTPAPTPESKLKVEAPIVVVPEVEGEKPKMPEGPIERGTQKWCDKMMLVSDSDWSDDDARLFAKVCLYE